MANQADHAKLALRIVEAIAQGNPEADALIADSFDDPMNVALAYAYLAGFMFVVLAAVDPSQSIDGVSAKSIDFLIGVSNKRSPSDIRLTGGDAYPNWCVIPESDHDCTRKAT